MTRSVTVATGPLVAEGRIVTIGNRVATSEATITDPTGQTVAQASSTCLTVRPAIMRPARDRDLGSRTRAAHLLPVHRADHE